MQAEESQPQFHQRVRAPPIQRSIRGVPNFEPLNGEERAELLAALDRDVLAPNSRAAHESLLRTWARYHARWFPAHVPPWPLTVDSLRAICAQLKSAGFRSAPNYLCAAKRHHLEHSFAWTNELAFAQKDCLAACQRGIGAPRQDMEIELLAVHSLQLGVEPLVPHGPICPGAWYALSCFHLMRELEYASACHRDLTFDTINCTETLVLPVGKTETTANGVARTWGCVCTPGGPSAPCPYHAGMFLAERTHELFADHEGVAPGVSPLFPKL